MNRRILIIGATSAIAEATARLWANEGARLFLVARNADRLEMIAADLRVRGAEAVHTAVLDANDFDRHETVIEQALRTLGGMEIALIAHGTLPDQQACQRDAGLALREIGTNALSVISLLTLLANRLEDQKTGTLGVISSVAGDRGRPSNYIYGAAKATVSKFAEGLRARLFKSGVHVIDIRPGFVATPMTQGLPLPAKLVATPERVARAIVAGIDRRRDVLYVPGFWRLVMTIIRLIPGPIFKRLNL